MKSARFLVVALMLHLVTVAAAQVPHRPRAGSPPIDSVRVSFNPPEKTVYVVGYVFDKTSRRPVHNVHVWCSGFPRRQARTDASGHFILYLPAQTYHSGRLVTVETLYYQGQAPISVREPVVLWLKRKDYRFTPFGGCHAPPDSVIKTSHMARSLLDVPIAFLIQNTTTQQSLKLRTISLRIGPGGFNRDPILLHIYQYNDDPEAPPGMELLNEDFLISPREDGVLTYDISSSNIEVSGKGFFLALEYPAGGSGYTYEPIPDYTPTGSILRPPRTQADIRTWVYKTAKGWQCVTAVENCWPLYESALSVEVEPAPAKR